MNKADLENLAKKNFFKVPSDYFDQLPYDVQNSINSTKTSPFVKIFEIVYLKPVFVILCFLGISIFLYVRKNTSETNKVSFSDTIVHLPVFDTPSLASNNFNASRGKITNKEPNKSSRWASMDILNSIDDNDILIYIENAELEEVYSED